MTDAKGTVLYHFTNNDGFFPNDLVRNAEGNLFGTTTDGPGSTGVGTLFRISP
jgi:uncharacterized repeat protein (TIGR03803 family)